MVNTFRVDKANWQEHSELMRKLRLSVFVIEQGVSEKIEWDGRDHLCQHVIAITNKNEIIGTGRLQPSGHIGRIAVLSHYRGFGVGKALLQKLVSIAAEANIEHIYLNSQTHATAFYQRFGFVIEGPVYMEAGIPHQRMELAQ